MKKQMIIFEFISSCVCAFIVGLIFWALREFIASIEAIWDSAVLSTIFNYDHFILVIVFLALPIGSLLGIFIFEKCFLSVSSFNSKRAILGFIFGSVGMLLLALIYYLTAGHKANEIMFVIRGDTQVIFLPVLSGFLTLLGYNLAK